MENSSDCLYEYVTLRSKIERLIDRIIERILCVVFIAIYFMALRSLLARVIEATGRHYVYAPFSIALPLILLLDVLVLLFFAVLFYKPERRFRQYPLTVRLSRGEIFISVPWPMRGRPVYMHREHIDIHEIKNAEVKVYTLDEYKCLYSGIYPENSWRRLPKDPLRTLFEDYSSRYEGKAICAVLELDNGQHFFIEFKDAEKFVEVLNNRRSQLGPKLSFLEEMNILRSNSRFGQYSYL